MLATKSDMWMINDVKRCSQKILTKILLLFTVFVNIMSIDRVRDKVWILLPSILIDFSIKSFRAI